MLSRMDHEAAARRGREQAAERYRPEHVRLLLVAEAPPSSLDRYFYFEDLRAQDTLFRYVVRTVLDEAPSRTRKAERLTHLRDRGVFLTDLKTDPKTGDEPEYVITIKANVCDLCQEPLRQAGLTVADERIPFPGSGQQHRFVEGMARPLRSIGWTA